MSYHDIDYDDDADEESETTLQSAREELEYWTEIFQEQKDEKPEEWMFYRNPFLDPLKPHELKDDIAKREREK